MPFRIITLLLLSVSTLFAQEGKENAEFKLAVGLYNDRMYDLALDQFKNFIAAYPTSQQGIDARFYLGETQLRLKRYDEARVTFQNFALTYTDNPKAPDAWVRAGEAFAGLGNPTEAALACERVQVFHPKSTVAPDALLKGGTYRREAGDAEGAVRDYRSIIQDYPGSGSVMAARLSLGELYTDAGDYSSAEREIKRVTESDAPAAMRAGAYLSLGRLRERKALFTEAETAFKAVVQQFKGTNAAAQASYELGRLALGGRNYAEAARFLRAAAADTSLPDSICAEALLFAGDACMCLGDRAGGLEAYSALVTRFPGNALAREALLRSGFAQSNAPGKQLDIAHKLLSPPRPEDKLEALRLRAMAAYAARRYPEAADAYATIADEFPDDPETPSALAGAGAICADRLQDFRKAMSFYDRIVERFPNTPEGVDARRAIAGCQEALGDIRGAITTLSDLRRIYPAAGGSEAAGGRIAFLTEHELRNTDAAVTRLARLMGEMLGSGTKGAQALALGEIELNDLKDFAAASKQFERAIDWGGLDSGQAERAEFSQALAVDGISGTDSTRRGEALEHYDLFLSRYPASRYLDSAASRRYAIASRGVRGDKLVALAGAHLMKYQELPGSARVFLDLGLAEEARGDMQRAAGDFDALVRNFPSSPHANRGLLELGKIALQRGAPDSAAAYWTELAGHRPIDPTTPEALAALARIAGERNDIGARTSYLERLRRDFSYTETGRSATGDLIAAYLADSMSSEAMALLRERSGSPLHAATTPWLPIAPEDQYLTASVLAQEGNRREAAGTYAAYVRTDRKAPSAGKAFLALGAIARASGETADASSYFKEAALAGGEATDAIADLLFGSGQYADAARQYASLAAAADSAAVKERLRSR